MSTTENPWVDLAKLRSLREDFSAAASTGVKLFHAVRVVIPCGRAPRAKPDEGWKDFLGDVEVFGARTYERPGLGSEQHSCYFGAKQRLGEYTGLAAVARGLITGDFVVVSDYHRNPQFDRDTWTLAVYRIAMRIPDELPFELEGAERYACTRPEDWFRSVITCQSSSEDWEVAKLRAWRKTAGTLSGYTPRFVYASLPLDVFRSSAIAFSYLLNNADRLYGPQDPGAAGVWQALMRQYPARTAAKVIETAPKRMGAGTEDWQSASAAVTAANNAGFAIDLTYISKHKGELKTRSRTLPGKHRLEVEMSKFWLHLHGPEGRRRRTNDGDDADDSTPKERASIDHRLASANAKKRAERPHD